MKKTILFFLLSMQLFSQTAIEKWQQGKVGALIHLGLFTVLEGDYKGTDYGKDAGFWGADWIQINAKIPKEEYAALQSQFNPKDFNANQWVKDLKAGGMQYLVMMAKHHEGFALFHSKASDFHIKNTPFKKDILKEISEACQQEDLLFGIYYSHSKDWYHRENIRREKEAPSKAYQKLVKTHLTELVSNYPIDFIAFASGDKYKDINSEYAKLVKKLNPKCFIGGRINGDKTLNDYDWKSFKQVLKKQQNFPTVCPISFRGSYGYDHDDNSWRSKNELIKHLCIAISRGSNIVYNIGVTPNGTFTEQDQDALQKLGNWITYNREAIYNISPSPFPYDFPFGVVSQKKNKLYLYLLNPKEKIKLEGIEGKIKSVTGFLDRKDLTMLCKHQNGTLTIPVSYNTSNVHVIEVAFEKAPTFIINKEKTYFWNSQKMLK